MKNLLLKFLTPALLVLGVFIFSKISLANSIFSQTVNNATEAHADCCGHGVQYVQSLGTGLSGTVNSITVSLSNSINGHYSYLQLMDCGTSADIDNGGTKCDFNNSGTYLGYWVFFTDSSGSTNLQKTITTTQTDYTFNTQYGKFYHGSYDPIGAPVLLSNHYYDLSVNFDYDGSTTHKIGASNTNTYANGKCKYYYGPYNCTNPDMYFIFDDGVVPPPSNMTVDVPANGAFISTATSTIVSGKCMTQGANQLELTTTPFLARLDSPSKYNITCTSQYTYSTTYKPLIGSNSIWIVDKSAIGENPPNIFNNQRYASTQYTGYSGSANSLSWLLTLEYPADNGSHAFVINPNTTQQFRFRFKVPDDSVKPQARIKTTLWTNSSRNVASTTNEFIGLDSLDLDGDGLLGLNVGPVPDGQTWYYTQYLENGTITMYSIPFSVYASSTAQSAGTTVNPAAPDDRQYGPCLNLPLIGLNNFCFGTMFYALVIPNPRFYKDDVNDTYGLMQTKIPFAFYYQLKDQLSGVVASSTDFTYNIPVNLASSTGVTLNIPFSSNNAGVHNVRSSLDPWFKAFAWFYFAWWAYRKAINFHF